MKNFVLFSEKIGHASLINALRFLPNGFCRLLEHILYLPADSIFPHDYAIEFNAKLDVSFLSLRFFFSFLF